MLSKIKKGIGQNSENGNKCRQAGDKTNIFVDKTGELIQKGDLFYPEFIS